jgi:hypothetical protein
LQPDLPTVENWVEPWTWRVMDGDGEGDALQLNVVENENPPGAARRM